MMPKLTLGLLAVGLAGMVLASVGRAAGDNTLVTAVYSRASKDYHRQKLPDGSLKHEFYAIANGGYSSGRMADPSIDSVRFPVIAGAAAQYLARQGYFLAKDSRSTNLLLVISWGTTIPGGDGSHRMALDGFAGAMNRLQTARASGPAGRVQTSVGHFGAPGFDLQSRGADGIQSPAAAVAQAAQDDAEAAMFQMQVFEDMRRRSNEYNARLLGYTDEINDRDNPSRYAGAGTYFDDLISDLESDRYYITIVAYDFHAATAEGRKSVLWSTRISVQAQGHRFNESLATMLARASGYFGQDSGRLVREERSGVVTTGELKVVGILPNSQPRSPGDQPKK